MLNRILAKTIERPVYQTYLLKAAIFFIFFVYCSIQDVVQKFREIDKDGSGRLDVEEAREGLKSLKTATGRTLNEREIEFFIQTTGSDDNSIDLGHFTNLMYRLKLYKADAPTTKIHA